MSKRRRLRSVKDKPFVLSEKQCAFRMPDGHIISVEPGEYPSQASVFEAVNKKIYELKLPFHIDDSGQLCVVADENGKVPEIVVPIDIIVERAMAQYPEGLRNLIEVFLAFKMIGRHCSQFESTTAWKFGEEAYRIFMSNEEPKGWPLTFTDFMSINFPEFKIPEEMKTGIVLARASDLKKLH